MKKEGYLARVSFFSYFKKKDLQRLAKRYAMKGVHGVQLTIILWTIQSMN